MKTVIKSAALFGAVSLLAACGGEENSDHSVDPNYHDIKATLFGTARNANNNDAIADESLKITFIQGDKRRNVKIHTDGKDTNKDGDYSISSIPASTAGNNTYRIEATAEGFQPFESFLAIPVTTDALQDRSVTMMADLQMYPLGSFANDVKVNVTYNNEPVEGAAVYLEPRPNSNIVTAGATPLQLFPDNGTLESIMAVTDANGVVTFPASNLVLGGRYNIDVMPTIHKGIDLATNDNSQSITIGTSNKIQNVTMSDIALGADDGLYVSSTSNLLDVVNANGILTLTFSNAVSFVNEDNITATLTNDTTAVLDVTDTVTGTLSTDGKTLTLKPNFSTAPVVWDGSNDATADNGLEVTFANAWVRIVGAANSSTAYDVFALTAETGGNPDDTVQVTETF